MAQKDNYRLLIEKLDQFIRKYYLNKLIRGLLYAVGLVGILFILINVLEYFYYFNPTKRKVLFYSFLSVSTLSIAYWILLPLLNYFRLGSLISHEKAAQIIGDHFVDVKDKLLNILQLKQQADASNENTLLIAGINQKTEEIKLVPFKSAINLSQNRKYLRYALPPLLLLLVILFTAPSIIKDSTTRLINNNKVYEKPAPFSFVIDNEDLQVVQYDDYELNITIEGNELPAEAFIYLDDVQYRLKKVAANKFSYEFKTVQNTTDFELGSGMVRSIPYELEVLKKPNISSFEVQLNYPNYTGRKDEALSNIGDLVVPVGTTIDWIFNAENTDNIAIQFSSESELAEIKRYSDDLFTYKRKALKDDFYKLFISNKLLPNADSVSYALSVIPDLYPTIKAEKFQDSTDNKYLFFAGQAADDYGLSLLTFNYRKKDATGKEGKLTTETLSSPSNKQVDFEHSFDLNAIELNPGDEITYYFEIFDNDRVNGNKSARTNLMIFSMPTIDEYQAMEEANDELIKEDLEDAIKDAKKLQDDMRKMKEKLLQEKELDWQDRKELEKMMERQNELEQKMERAKEAFEENMQNQEEFSQQDEEILEKQQQLQEMFEEVMTPEMQELMDKIQELMQELEKDQAIDMMEEMEMNDEQLEKNMDRLLELYKQLEVEKEMKEAIDELEKLAEEQEELQKETEQMNEEQEQEQDDQQNDQQEGEENKDEQKQTEENKESDQQKNEEQSDDKKNNESKEQNDQQEKKDGEEKSKQEELTEKQDELNKEFEKLQEKMEKTKEKNDELESPMQMDDNKEQMDDIKQEMNDSKQQLQKQQNNKASQSQKNAAQKMKQMAQSMSQSMQSNQMQQMQEDMQALRQLLENLVGLSFNQEELIDDFASTVTNTPRYVELVQEQFKIKDNFKIVEDSLQALSKRVFQIESFVTEKVTEINSNFNAGLEDLEERRKPQANDHQQRVMKNLNDLALMLSETMNQMQQQMSAMMKGNQMCTTPTPGQGGQPQDKLSQGQQQLNQQMQQMKDGMQGGQPGKGNSEEFAKMAARQAALRKALEEKQRKLREQGNGDKQLQDLINEMDKVEKDLVNKRLQNETLMRQKDILTRLLKHEKAEREREYDNQRKSETAAQKERKMPPALEEYLKQRKSEIEIYRTVSPTLKPYYKTLVEEYIKSLKTK
ncbi:MAG: DUF4175 family protein [Bacteroidota bacterium]